MNRRTLLAGGGSALATLASGCIDGTAEPAPSETPSPPCDVPLNDGGPDVDRLVEAWAHTDVPPHDIASQRDVESEANWNADYLGSSMPTSPSLDFETHDVSRADVDDRLHASGGDQYVVELVDPDDDETAILADLDVDDQQSTLVLVGECCGSSSVRHRWARVQQAGATIHLHGYLEQPWVRTSDLSPRYSLVEVSRPAADVDQACVSLTTGREERLHVNSNDGVVSLVNAVLANDSDRRRTIDLRLRTTDGETRVDDSVTVDANTEWMGVGTVGEVGETLTVTVRGTDPDVDVRTDYDLSNGALGIRLGRAGGPVVGPSREI